MAVVTVVGSSGGAVQVTVDGGRAQTLAQDYAQQILTAYTDGKFTSDDFTTSGNNIGQVPSQPITVAQGVISAGGGYTVSGDYTHLVIGTGVNASVSADTPVDPQLNQRVTVNAINISSAFLSVLSGDLAGVDFTAGNYNGSFVATTGDNAFRATGTTGNWTIVTGQGNNQIYTSDGNNEIQTGVGNNSIRLGKGTNNVSLYGTDTVDGTIGGRANVTVYSGNANLNLATNSYVHTDASVTVGSTINVGNTSTVDSAINSTITFSGASGSIIGGSGDTISAAGDLYLAQGSNHTISVNGALSFINGTGNTSVTTQYGTVWGASGLNLSLSADKYLIYTTNQPGSTGDQNINASNSTGKVEFWTGPGSQTLIGGSGFNHFVFGTAFQGTSGDSFATVRSGQGLNDFGVLKGHSGGHITIEDFMSNAGNKFFMYNYKPANAAQAVQKLLDTAVVNGNNTTITLDNNMTVTFVGITHLNASNFDIS